MPTMMEIYRERAIERDYENAVLHAKRVFSDLMTKAALQRARDEARATSRFSR